MKQIKLTKKIQKYAEVLHQATRDEKVDIITLKKLAYDAMELHKLLLSKQLLVYIKEAEKSGVFNDE